MSLDMNSSEFLYLISSRRTETLFPEAESVCLGRNLLQHTGRTRCAVLRQEDRELCVAGLCAKHVGVA